jgi:hypothetical protein
MQSIDMVCLEVELFITSDCVILVYSVYMWGCSELDLHFTVIYKIRGIGNQCHQELIQPRYIAMGTFLHEYKQTCCY